MCDKSELSSVYFHIVFPRILIWPQVSASLGRDLSGKKMRSQTCLARAQSGELVQFGCFFPVVQCPRMQDSGLIATWNKANPSDAIAVADRFVEIEGETKKRLFSRDGSSKFLKPAGFDDVLVFFEWFLWQWVVWVFVFPWYSLWFDNFDSPNMLEKRGWKAEGGR